MGESLENGQDSPAPYIPGQDTLQATNKCQSTGSLRGREQMMEASTCLVSVSESVSTWKLQPQAREFQELGQTLEREMGTALERKSRVEGSGPSKLFKSSFLALVSISSFLQAQP